MSTSQSFATSQPCVDRGVLYMATNHGLYALDAKTGAERWLARINGISGAPLVLGQSCYIGAKKGLFAVAISNGRKKCVYASAASVSTPACADGVLYFLDEQHLVAMEAEQGKVLWKTAAQEHKYPRPGPAILDDLIFFPDEERRLAAGERSSGRKQWALKFDDGDQSNPFWWKTVAAAHNRVVALDRQAALHGIDAQNGQRQWVYDANGKADGIGSAGPVIAGKTVYATIIEKTSDILPSAFACAIDLLSGKLLWRIGALKEDDSERASWYCPPAIHEGLLYVQSGLGIYAFK